MRAGAPRLTSVLLAIHLLGSQAAGQLAPLAGDAQFRVFLRGAEIGTASVSVSRTGDGWSIRGSSHVGTPRALSVDRFEVDYTDAWQPRFATIEITAGQETVLVHGGFIIGGADRVDIVRARQVVFVTPLVSDHALVLPQHAYGAYEALAMRLRSSSPGDELRAYVFPHREIRVRLDGVNDQTLVTGERRISVQRWRVVFLDPAGIVPATVWVEGGRLARLDFPEQELSIQRLNMVAE